jgi:hypothetical protein
MAQKNALGRLTLLSFTLYTHEWTLVAWGLTELARAPDTAGGHTER